MPNSTSRNWSTFNLEELDRRRKEEKANSTSSRSTKGMIARGYKANSLRKCLICNKRIKNKLFDTHLQQEHREIWEKRTRLKNKGSVKPSAEELEQNRHNVKKMFDSLKIDSSRVNFENSNISRFVVRWATTIKKIENLSNPTLALEWLASTDASEPDRIENDILFQRRLSRRRLGSFGLIISRKYKCQADERDALQAFQYVARALLNIEEQSENAVILLISSVTNDDTNVVLADTLRRRIDETMIGELVMKWANQIRKMEELDGSILVLDWLRLVTNKNNSVIPESELAAFDRRLSRSQILAYCRKLGKYYGIPIEPNHLIRLFSLVAGALFNNIALRSSRNS